MIQSLRRVEQPAGHRLHRENHAVDVARLLDQPLLVHGQRRRLELHVAAGVRRYSRAAAEPLTDPAVTSTLPSVAMDPLARCGLFGRRSGDLDDLLPFRRFTLDHRAELLGRTAGGRDAGRGEVLAHFRRPQHLVKLLVQAVDDRGRGSRTNREIVLGRCAEAG